MITRSSFAYSRMPMCRIRNACCARAASGDIAIPPMTFLNSHRSIAGPKAQAGLVSLQNSTPEGIATDIDRYGNATPCPLWVDTVEKRFCGPECATLIQNRGRVRNFDSNTLLFGFD